MDRFMANIDGIATLAFLGTLISTFAMGGVVWGAGALGLCPPFSPLPALLFGSVVSATDPVTVLAVFQRLGAHPDLYSLVFGESVLNDAVAMVLYRSLSTFLATPVTPAALAAAAASFVGVFVGSMLVRLRRPPGRPAPPPACADACSASRVVQARLRRLARSPRLAPPCPGCRWAAAWRCWLRRWSRPSTSAAATCRWRAAWWCCWPLPPTCWPTASCCRASCRRSSAASSWRRTPSPT